MKAVHCLPRCAGIALLALALLLLNACMAEETVLLPTEAATEAASPAATAAPEPTPTAPLEPVDVDFSTCTEPLEKKPYMPFSLHPHRILRRALTGFPATAQVERACALRDLGGVILVGTDETGRQFLVGLSTETWTCEVFYTLGEGMRVTSLGQAASSGRYNESGAFAWTETDGDAWRLRLYDERLQEGESAELLAETTLASGALSQGSAFLPQLRSLTTYWDTTVYAVYDSPEGAVRLELGSGETFALSGFTPFCCENAPIWSPAYTIAFAIVQQDGQLALRVWKEDKEAGEMYEDATFTLRLPDGEMPTKLLSTYWGYADTDDYSFCLLTDAGNLYWYDWEKNAYDPPQEETLLVARDVVAAEPCSHAEAWFLSPECDNLLKFRDGEGSVTAFRLSEKPVELTAVTSAYTDERLSEPHEVFVFGSEEGVPVVFVLEQGDTIRDYWGGE